MRNIKGKAMELIYDNLSVNEQGHLTVGGIDTAELAAEYGTPLYIIDEDVVRKNCRTDTQAMHKYFGADAAPLYASKALCLKGIYPVGEGAGYAGGITTAAVDGIKTFEKYASIYRP